MQWWVIVVAAVLAVLFLFQSVGVKAGAGLTVACVVGLLGYRLYRARRGERARTVQCLRCGETLSATARSCKYCGSASWTYIN